MLGTAYMHGRRRSRLLWCIEEIEGTTRHKKVRVPYRNDLFLATTWQYKKMEIKQ